MYEKKQNKHFIFNSGIENTQNSHATAYQEQTNFRKKKKNNVA